MRWGFSKLRWARPLKNILCFYGDKNLKINLLGYSSKNYILDSDLLTEKKIKIKSINQYFDELSNYNIIIDHNERKKIILNEAKKISKTKGLKLLVNQNLLTEVANLVERPKLFLADFDKKYLSLPIEVLTTSMIKNQKYFPLYNKDNSLSNHFLIVSNLNPNDKRKQIIYGNKRVIEARLEMQTSFGKKIKIQILKIK